MCTKRKCLKLFIFALKIWKRTFFVWESRNKIYEVRNDWYIGNTSTRKVVIWNSAEGCCREHLLCYGAKCKCMFNYHTISVYFNDFYVYYPIPPCRGAVISQENIETKMFQWFFFYQLNLFSVFNCVEYSINNWMKCSITNKIFYLFFWHIIHFMKLFIPILNAVMDIQVPIECFCTTTLYFLDLIY